jgi:hypothetical protein
MVTSLIVAWVLVSPLVDIEDGKLQPFPTLVTMLLLLVVYIPAFRLLIIQQKRLKYPLGLADSSGNSVLVSICPRNSSAERYRKPLPT